VAGAEEPIELEVRRIEDRLHRRDDGDVVAEDEEVTKSFRLGAEQGQRGRGCGGRSPRRRSGSRRARGRRGRTCPTAAVRPQLRSPPARASFRRDGFSARSPSDASSRQLTLLFMLLRSSSMTVPRSSWNSFNPAPSRLSLPRSLPQFSCSSLRGIGTSVFGTDGSGSSRLEPSASWPIILRPTSVNEHIEPLRMQPIPLMEGSSA